MPPLYQLITFGVGDGNRRRSMTDGHARADIAVSRGAADDLEV